MVDEAKVMLANPIAIGEFKSPQAVLIWVVVLIVIIVPIESFVARFILPLKGFKLYKQIFIANFYSMIAGIPLTSVVGVSFNQLHRDEVWILFLIRMGVGFLISVWVEAEALRHMNKDFKGSLCYKTSLAMNVASYIFMIAVFWLLRGVQLPIDI